MQDLGLEEMENSWDVLGKNLFLPVGEDKEKKLKERGSGEDRQALQGLGGRESWECQRKKCLGTGCHVCGEWVLEMKEVFNVVQNFSFLSLPIPKSWAFFLEK